MKILLAAHACDPSGGSEAAVGWMAACALARRHEVWVLANVRFKPSFDAWRRSHAVPENLHFHFVGMTKPRSSNQLLGRIEDWREFGAWSRSALEAARELHREIGFDLVHHVTIATWRVASPLWQLGIPFVWGPLGGGEAFPWRCAGVLSPSALAFEVVRVVSNFVSERNAAVRRCAREAAACVAGTRETRTILCRISGNAKRVHALCVSFFAEEKIGAFAELLPRKTADGRLRLFAGGCMEGRKGVSIALDALGKLKGSGTIFSYRFGGSGPESVHLQKLSGKLGIAEDVVFGEGLQGEAYLEELMGSHIYLLPSLRDNAPRTLMEAMLAGCVPIVVADGGPGEIVTEECGFRVRASTPRRMAEEIAGIIRRLDADRGLLKSLGIAAHRRIAAHYGENRYLDSMEAIYGKVLGKS